MIFPNKTVKLQNILPVTKFLFFNWEALFNIVNIINNMF